MLSGQTTSNERLPIADYLVFFLLHDLQYLAKGMAACSNHLQPAHVSVRFYASLIYVLTLPILGLPFSLHDD